MQPPRRIRRRDPGDPAPLEAAGLHPVLARVYAARRVCDPAELDLSVSGLPDYRGLLGIEAAAARLARAVEAGESVLVVGDFDADGATSCALVLRGLRAMGARRVDFLVPDRFRYGYGLTPEIVAVAARRRPHLLVTVDNGIGSVAGVAAAHAAGMEVIITDHHLPGPELPAAAAIVNPNQPGDGFPAKSLAGVGVAFYLLLAVRARLRESGWFARRPEPRLAAWLDLVALGTVADVVPLDRVNRILVAQGLARIRAGETCPGIRALLEVAGRDPARCVASDLAFAAAPRLNAAGRLTDMSLGIRCLLCDEPAEASALAQQLDELNRRRRDIEARMQDEALAALERLDLDGGTLPPALCVYDPGWHPGVVGILAARLKERFHRPVVAFAPDGEGGLLKGSARSVPDLHMRDLLDAVATRHPSLLSRFGGHAMAAGLSLPAAHLEAFGAALAEEAARAGAGRESAGTVESDGPLDPADFQPELAGLLRYGGPWGAGFPEPVFDGRFRVADWRTVGGDGRHLRLTVQPAEEGPVLEAIAFNQAPPPGLAAGTELELAYRLDLNHFRGTTRLQLMVEHLAPAGPVP